ncbi:MAG: nucleotidyltransferase [Negativicutes bacterium]|jgi:predicted nucleotidyltransferase
MSTFSNATGIIAEYNPFHNGHKYHINKTRELFGTPVVAVMSGNFVQRGEPALFDKQLRAKSAVQNGVDLVLELPTVFATCSAEHFAAGAVRLLDSLGIVSDICCGAESDQLLNSAMIADSINLHSLKTAMKSGISYANAMVEIAPAPKKLTPNNILAIEYQRAIRKFKCNLKLYTIKRIANYYHEKTTTGQISSATAIRAIFNDSTLKTTDWKQQIPANSVNEIEQYLVAHKLCRLEDFWEIVSYRLRTFTALEIAERFEISEGLENRFTKCVNNSSSMTELLYNVKSKRYTYTRLQRILIHLLLDTTLKDLQSFRITGSLYIRPLAWTTVGEQLLKEIANRSSLPIVIQPAKFLKKESQSLAATMLNYDIAATKIHSIISNIDPLGDFRRMPIKVNAAMPVPAVLDYFLPIQTNEQSSRSNN